MNAADDELLRAALGAAFPERGIGIAHELRRWFDDTSASRLPLADRRKDDGSRPCDLCERPNFAILVVVRLVPATKRKRAQYRIPGANAPMEAPPGALHVCSPCLSAWTSRVEQLGSDPSKWLHPDMVLAEARRALQMEGSEAAAALLQQIEDRRVRTAPAATGTATCDVCRARRLTVAGRRKRVCLECLAHGHSQIYALLAALPHTR